MTLPEELKKALEAEMYKEPHSEMVIEMNDVVRVVASFLETARKDLDDYLDLECKGTASALVVAYLSKVREKLVAVFGEERKGKENE